MSNQALLASEKKKRQCHLNIQAVALRIPISIFHEPIGFCIARGCYMRRALLGVIGPGAGFHAKISSPKVHIWRQHGMR